MSDVACYAEPTQRLVPYVANAACCTMWRGSRAEQWPWGAVLPKEIVVLPVFPDQLTSLTLQRWDGEKGEFSLPTHTAPCECSTSNESVPSLSALEELQPCL